MSEAKFGEWQPIETAPMDDTAILTWYGRSCWIASFSDGYWFSDDLTLIHPTHWMALPEPPL